MESEITLTDMQHLGGGGRRWEGKGWEHRAMRRITLQRLGSLTIKQATSKEHSMHVFVFCLQEAEKPATVCPADDCVLFLTCRK